MRATHLLAASALFLIGTGCSRYQSTEAPAIEPIGPTKKIETAAPTITNTSTITTTSSVKVLVAENFLTENTVGGPSYLTLFATSSKAIYLRRVPDGLGGYIIFETVQTPLLRLDLETGQVRKITTKKLFTSAQDVMPDDSLIAYVVNEDAAGKGIVTLDPSSNLQKFYPITPPAPYTIIGDLHFSPDGQELAFALAASNPDKERGAVYRLNLKTGKTTLVATTAAADNTYLRIHGWTPQGTIIYK